MPTHPAQRPPHRAPGSSCLYMQVSCREQVIAGSEYIKVTPESHSVEDSDLSLTHTHTSADIGRLDFTQVRGSQTRGISPQGIERKPLKLVKHWSVG